jgi:hypothetical protein
VNEIDFRPSGAITNFKPEEAKANDAKADALIAYAKKVKDWPLLAEAIDAKLALQGEFVTWWEKNVRGPGKVNSRRTGLIEAPDAEKQAEIKHQQVSRWRNRLKDPEKYKAMLFEAANAKAMAEKGNNINLIWTGNPEWYTPERFIEAARLVMGGIDLDPASSADAQQIVRAARWHGLEDNGLKQPWSGRVFLNPPYSHPEVANFVGRLCDHYEDGSVEAAVLLTNNNTDTRFWHRAAAIASGVCFTLGRISFWNKEGIPSQPANGQTFFYFGAAPGFFRSVFSDFGIVLAVGD